MKGKSLQVAVLTTLIALGVIVTSATIVIAESGDTTSEKKLVVLRYSETCAHGHNGFDCKPSAYRMDITDLQERITVLEKRMSKP